MTGDHRSGGSNVAGGRAHLDRRLRAAFVEGAKEDSPRICRGRGLTRDELERVLRRYPGEALEPTVSPPDRPSGDAA